MKAWQHKLKLVYYAMENLTVQKTIIDDFALGVAAGMKHEQLLHYDEVMIPLDGGEPALRFWKTSGTQAELQRLLVKQGDLDRVGLYLAGAMF